MAKCRMSAKSFETYFNNVSYTCLHVINNERSWGLNKAVNTFKCKGFTKSVISGEIMLLCGWDIPQSIGR